MSLFPDSSAAWAALVIVVLPLLIIGAGELVERMRQRDSPFQPAVSTVRVWVVPLLTVWIVARALLDVATDNVFLRLLGSAIILAGASAALSALRVVAADLADRPRRTGRRPIPRLLLALPRLLLILATLWVLIAGVWGVNLSAALTALGVTSLVISFALQDTLSGIASGFTLLADQPFAPGDWIESEQVEGRVIDVNWRSTRIQDRNGDLIVIPNGQLATATITNYDQPTRFHRVTMPVQIERTAPPTAAIEMLVAAARSTPGVVEDPPPFAWVTQIADPVVDYQALMWIEDYTIAPQVKADFGALVWYMSYRHDVPLPNPAQDLYLFDGSKTAIESQITSADVRRRIASAPLTTDLGDEVLDKLAATSSVGRYRRGETIIVEGAQNDLFLLIDGRAALVLTHDGEVELGVVDFEPGEMFGVLNEPPDAQRTALVVARTDCEVVRIPPEAAGQAIAVAPDLAGLLEQTRRDATAAHRSSRPAVGAHDRSVRPGRRRSDTERNGHGRRRRLVSSPVNQRLRRRLASTLVGVSLVSVLLLSGVNYVVARYLIDDSVEEQLVAVRETRVQALEVGTARIQARASSLATNPSVVEALADLSAAFDELDEDITPDEAAALAALYDTEVLPPFVEAGVDLDGNDFIPSSPAGRYLQQQYIVDNPDGFDERDRLDDAGDGSDYSAVHAEHHPLLRALKENALVSDLLLVDIDTGDVVYSTMKRVDFGSNVFTGPHGFDLDGDRAALGAVTDLLSGVAVGEGVISDTVFYVPTAGNPVFFVAAAVRSGSDVIGAVITEIPIEALTSIMTANEDWELLGLGETGESFIVGPDQTLRSNSRSWIEDSEGYLRRYVDRYDDQAAADLIATVGSPVLLQEVDNASVTAALEGEEYIGYVTNYLGTETLAASGPAQIGGLDWAVVVEVDVSETNGALNSLVRSMLVVLAVLLPTIAAVGVLLSRILTRSGRAARRMRPLGSPDGDLDDRCRRSRAQRTRRPRSPTRRCRSSARGG